MSLSLDIDLSRQTMSLCEGARVLRRFEVSTAANGPGELNGSGCTPRGAHAIRARIGDGLPEGAVLRARRWTGEIWSPELHAQFPGRDWILTRILWLSGTERGRNRLGCVDTFRRYIYLHGTPPVTRLGAPGSKGCVRVANGDLLELFPLTTPGMPVYLHE